ncbi:MAG: lysozyme [Pseudomonadota bacterium]
MRTSKAGIELIKSFEGFQPLSTTIGKGRWVIGYGHVKAAREGLRITRENAESVLREYDLPPIEAAIRRRVLAPIHQNEFDALVSFVFSIGIAAFERSDVLTRLNAGDFLGAAESMGAWRKARVNGQPVVIDALVRRRASERAMFLEHPGGRTAVVSASLKPEADPDWHRTDGLIADERALELVEEIDEAAHEDDSGAEVAAKAVAERLTRILGEGGSTEQEPAYVEEPSEDEIRKAVSALSGDTEPDSPEPVEDYPPVERIISSNRIVDDLEPAMIPPPPGPVFEPVEPVPLPVWLPYVVLAVFGAMLSIWGLFRADEAATDAAANQGVLAGVVGAFLCLVMGYYAVRSLGSDS